MGTKITNSIAASQLYEGVETDGFDTAVLSAILKDTSIPAALIGASASSLATKVDSYYSYGKNSTFYRLPTLVTNDGFIDDTAYPIATIKQDRIYTLDLETDRPDLVKDATGLLTKLEVNLEDLTKQLKENKDQASLEDVFVHVAVNVLSDEPAAIGYLFDLFTLLETESPNTRAQAEAEALAYIEAVAAALPGAEDTIYSGEVTTLTGYELNSNFLNISEDNTYSQEFRWDWIEATEVEGSIGLLDDVTRTIYVTGNMTEEEALANGLGSLNGYTGGIEALVLRRQVSRTHYKQVIVQGLNWTTNNIWKSSVLHSMQDVNNAFTDPDNNSSTIFMPVLHDLAREGRNSVEASKLFVESLYMHMNVSVHTKVKRWKQILGFILIVVAVVVTVISLGAATPITGPIISAVSTALLVVGVTNAVIFALIIFLTSLLVTLVYKIAIGMIIAKIFEEIAEEIGGELALVLLAVVAVYQSVKGDFTALNKLMPEAGSMMSVFNAGIQGITTYTENAIEDLYEGYKEFQDDIAELQKLLDEKNGLLNPEIDRNPLDAVLTAPDQRNIDPDTYYTIYGQPVNMVDMVLDAPNNFHATALDLPKPGAQIDLIT